MTMLGTDKVLIVDDEAMIRVLLRQLLERANVDQSNILTAEDGEKALVLVASERPGLIFLDLMLPKLNGYHVCREVRAIPGYDPYIIILTGRGYNTDREQAREFGANGFMTKPFNPSRLMEELEYFWNRY
jgi:DNA-binding response OmpR family regulator